MPAKVRSEAPSKVETVQMEEAQEQNPARIPKDGRTEDAPPDPCVRAVTRSPTPDAEAEERWALDLFSGTGSVKKALEKMGYKVISVDADPKWQADKVEDIRRWRYWEEYQPGASMWWQRRHRARSTLRQ
jgi:hypothetical protein